MCTDMLGSANSMPLSSYKKNGNSAAPGLALSPRRAALCVRCMLHVCRMYIVCMSHVWCMNCMYVACMSRDEMCIISCAQTSWDLQTACRCQALKNMNSKSMDSNSMSLSSSKKNMNSKSMWPKVWHMFCGVRRLKSAARGDAPGTAATTFPKIATSGITFPK